MVDVMFFVRALRDSRKFSLALAASIWGDYHEPSCLFHHSDLMI